ncbi:MAG: cation diffusion facilitator family transporter [Bacteroidales bacterium]|nr:cation diffusion facilitator family transporter [Bacteroidales bacterium]MCF8344674.1 cation diffusion facilitator family transporter [Bacteroidales bacterium]MCF8351476.1 cation diffusion facilitator family transporter [Bacteroidales bacterium]MCF8375697.1 cation diffusion facilitator family transporter [Bacteroidales bacterium]MCF8400297.1 cation diffusion facilitator family transporter [Bacteroidales bacterium]
MHLSLKEKKESKNLFITILLNFVITVAEIIGGLLSNSLALISDALHNFSDGLAVLITYIAVKISRKESTPKKTFGYKRIQILAALLNAVVLIVISIYLLYEAYHRFMEPEPIKSVPMFIVATIGLLANFVAVYLLRKHKKGNINIRSAYVHLIGDTLSSLAVIIGGVLIFFFEIYWIDPLITVLISVYIIKETISILLETYNILMQGTPKDIDVYELKRQLENLEMIRDIHHIHVWNLSDTDIHFEAHVNLEKDIRLSESESILRQVEKVLERNYGIHHVTLQMEHNFCDDKETIKNGIFIKT